MNKNPQPYRVFFCVWLLHCVYSLCHLSMQNSTPLFPTELLPRVFVITIETCKMKAFRTNNISFQLVWRIPHFLCQFSVRKLSWREACPEKNIFPFFWCEGGRSKQLQWDSYIGYWQSTANAHSCCISLHSSVSWTVKGNTTLKWNTEFWGR